MTTEVDGVEGDGGVCGVRLRRAFEKMGGGERERKNERGMRRRARAVRSHRHAFERRVRKRGR